MEDNIWKKPASLATFCGLFPSHFPRVCNCCSLTSASVYGQVAHECCCLWTHCLCSSTISRQAVEYPPLETVKTQQDKALAVLSGVGWGPTSNRTPDYTTFRSLFQSTSVSNEVLHNIPTKYSNVWKTFSYSSTQVTSWGTSAQTLWSLKAHIDLGSHYKDCVKIPKRNCSESNLTIDKHKP